MRQSGIADAAVVGDLTRRRRRSWAGYWLPRPVNPIAWWIYAISLAAAASLTANLLVCAVIVAVVAVVVLRRRGDGPWGNSFILYLWLGLAIVIIRVAYRIVFGGGDGPTVVFTLPQIPLPAWVGGLRLFGPVSAEALLGGFADGLRLASVVICFGAANALANPRRLLAQLPTALHELAAVLVVAVNLFAQLADSLRRVRRAQALRPPDGGVRGRRRRLIRGTVIPVITDALDGSLALATSMDVRGYGRTGALAPKARRLSSLLILVAMGMFVLGVYLLLAGGSGLWTSAILLALGLAAAALGFGIIGRTVRRTRYRPEGWGTAEMIIVLAGLAPVVGIVWVLAGDSAGILLTAPGQWPQVDGLTVLCLGLALAPAFLTPVTSTVAARGDQGGERP